MKADILKYFKTDRSHAAGVALVIKHSNRLSLKKQLNIHPQSDYMTGIVYEELRELAGISREDLHDILVQPISKNEPDEKVIVPCDPGDAPEDHVPASGKMIKQAPAAAEKKASRKK